MHRALRCESAVCNDKRIARAQEIHRRKCKNVKAVINIKAPQRFAHLANNAKKKQLMEERQKMIDQSNRHLVNKLERISNPIKSDAKGTSSFMPGLRLGPDQCTMVDHRNAGSGRGKSLRDGVRRRDKLKIQAENQALVARILDSTGTCRTTEELRGDWKQVQKYLKNSRTVKDRKQKQRRRKRANHKTPARPTTLVSSSARPSSSARQLKLVEQKKEATSTSHPIAAWSEPADQNIVQKSAKVEEPPAKIEESPNIAAYEQVEPPNAAKANQDQSKEEELQVVACEQPANSAETNQSDEVVVKAPQSSLDEMSEPAPEPTGENTSVTQESFSALSISSDPPGDLQIFSGGVAVTGNPLSLTVTLSTDSEGLPQLTFQAACMSFGSTVSVTDAPKSELVLKAKDLQLFADNLRDDQELYDADLDLESWLINHNLSGIHRIFAVNRIRTVCELQQLHEQDISQLLEDHPDKCKQLLHALQQSNQPSAASEQLKIFRGLKKYLAYDEDAQRLSVLPLPKPKRRSKRKSSSTGAGKTDNQHTHSSSSHRKSGRKSSSGVVHTPSGIVVESSPMKTEQSVVTSTITVLSDGKNEPENSAPPTSTGTSHSKEYTRFHGALTLQGVYRMLQAKKKLHRLKVDRTNESGTMHPMPGTEEGGSGWYQAKSEVFYFHVDQGTGEWSKVQGPLSELEWKHQRVKEFRSQPTPTPTTTTTPSGDAQSQQSYEPQQQEGGEMRQDSQVKPNQHASQQAAGDVEQNKIEQELQNEQNKRNEEERQKRYHEAVWIGATKFQALYRQRRARRAVAKSVMQFGTLLAMPGTIQGNSGWYEMDDEAIEYHVEVIDDNCGGVTSTADNWIKKRGPIGRQEWRLLNCTETKKKEGTSGAKKTK